MLFAKVLATLVILLFGTAGAAFWFRMFWFGRYYDHAGYLMTALGWASLPAGLALMLALLAVVWFHKQLATEKTE